MSNGCQQPCQVSYLFFISLLPFLSFPFFSYCFSVFYFLFFFSGVFQGFRPLSLQACVSSLPSNFHLTNRACQNTEPTPRKFLRADCHVTVASVYVSSFALSFALCDGASSRLVNCSMAKTIEIGLPT